MENDNFLPAYLYALFTSNWLVQQQVQRCYSSFFTLTDLQFVVDATYFDGVLEEVLILFLDINGHWMEVMYLEALVGSSMLMLDFMVVICFSSLWFMEVLVVFPIIVNNTGKHAGQKGDEDLVRRHMQINNKFLFSTDKHLR